MLAGQVQQPLQHSHAGDAPTLQHRLGPTHAANAQTPHLGEQILGAMLDGVDLLGDDVLVVRAELPRQLLRVQRDRRPVVR